MVWQFLLVMSCWTLCLLLLLCLMVLKDLLKALHMIYQQLQEIMLVVAEIREKNTVMKTQVDVHHGHCSGANFAINIPDPMQQL